MSDEDNLARLAEEEILNETHRAAIRASQAGALGWKKCPLKPTNKKFLQNTLIHALSSNKHRDRTSRSPSARASSLRLCRPQNKLKSQVLDKSGETSQVTLKDFQKSKVSNQNGDKSASKNEIKDFECESRKKQNSNKRTAK